MRALWTGLVLALWVTLSVMGAAAQEAAKAETKDKPKGFLESLFGPPKKYETLQELLSQHQCAVEQRGKVTHITWQGDALWGEGDYIATPGTILRVAGQWMKENDKWPSGPLSMTINAQLVDRLGNEKRTDVLRLAVNVEDLRQANYRNVYGRQILNFTRIEWSHPLGLRAAVTYCKDNAEASREFCLDVVRRVSAR